MSLAAGKTPVVSMPVGCGFSYSEFLMSSPWSLGLGGPENRLGRFPGGSDGEASACNAGDPGLIPELGRSLGEGNGNPLQYSCLENSMDGGAWWPTVHGVTKSHIRLSDFMSDVERSSLPHLGLRRHIYFWRTRKS